MVQQKYLPVYIFEYIQGKIKSLSKVYTFNCVLMHLHQNHVWKKNTTILYNSSRNTSDAILSNKYVSAAKSVQVFLIVLVASFT